MGFNDRPGCFTCKEKCGFVSCGRLGTGYPHDGRADKDSYPHNGLAIKDFYPHDGRADKDSYPYDSHADKDSYPHDRHNLYTMLSLYLWLTFSIDKLA